MAGKLHAPGNARRLAGVLLWASLASGCAIVVPQTAELRHDWPATLAETIDLPNVPFFPQEENQCGPAALATALGYAGLGVTPRDLVSSVYLPSREGSLQVEMLAAPRRFGIVSYTLAPKLEALLREVAAGNPVIVLQNFGVWPVPLWHYAVVVGYDRLRGDAILRSGRKERLRTPFAVLEYVWKASGYWAMVALPAGRSPATANESDYAAAITAMARVGDPGAAGSAYAELLRRWPDSLVGAVGLANSHVARGQTRQAESILRAALERKGDSAPLLNNLAQVLSDQGRNEEALEVIDRALRNPGPFSAAAGDTKATIVERMAAARR